MHLFLDLETTNLAPRTKTGYVDYKDTEKYDSCRIIQIYMALYDKDELIDEIHTYVDPKMPIPEKSKEITKITDEMVKDKKITTEMISKMNKMLKTTTLVIGHNINFDVYILASELHRMKKENLAKNLFYKKRFCTMKNAHLIQKGGKYTKLETLYSSFYTEKIGDAHDAKTDVLMCKKIFDIYKQFEKIKI